MSGQILANIGPGWVRRVIRRALLNGVLLLQTSVRSVTASTAILSGPLSYIIVPYTVTGAVSITLPAASGYIGVPIIISDTGANASSNNITIGRAGSDTITTTAKSETSVTISTDGGSVKLIAIDSTTWKVL